MFPEAKSKWNIEGRWKQKPAFSRGTIIKCFVILLYLSTQKYAGRRAGTKIGRDLNVDDLIKSESKVQVFVSLCSL